MRDELQALGDVRPVIPDRVGDRVRDHDQRRAVDDRADVRVLGEDPVDQRAVGDVALIKGAARGELAPAGHQAVQDHRADPRVQAGRRDRAADIPGPPGDQHLHRSPPAFRAQPTDRRSSLPQEADGTSYWTARQPCIQAAVP